MPAAARERFLLTVVDALSDVQIVMSEGRPLAEGPPDAVRRDPRVLAAYLGARHAHAP